MWWGNRRTATGPRIHRGPRRAPWVPVPGGHGSGRSRLRVGHQEDGFASGYAAKTWWPSLSVAGVLPIGSKLKERSSNEGCSPKSALYARSFLRSCLPILADSVFAAYLKCSAEIDVSRPPYLLSSLTPEGETIRRLAQCSFACFRRNTIPCSMSLANLRRTVVREPKFSRKSCFSVSGCPCSTAYPISITISKSTTDLRKGSCCLSNSLIFFNPVNNFMVHIVLLKVFRCYCVASLMKLTSTNRFLFGTHNTTQSRDQEERSRPQEQPWRLAEKSDQLRLTGCARSRAISLRRPRIPSVLNAIALD